MTNITKDSKFLTEKEFLKDKIKKLEVLSYFFDHYFLQNFYLNYLSYILYLQKENLEKRVKVAEAKINNIKNKLNTTLVPKKTHVNKLKSIEETAILSISAMSCTTVFIVRLSIIFPALVNKTT